MEHEFCALHPCHLTNSSCILIGRLKQKPSESFVKRRGSSNNVTLNIVILDFFYDLPPKKDPEKYNYCPHEYLPLTFTPRYKNYSELSIKVAPRSYGHLGEEKKIHVLEYLQIRSNIG